MQQLNYHHLYYFWNVAKEGSFTRAAEKLLVAQSAVSLQVSQLEEYLGKKLIDRTTSKKLSLTEDGHIAFGRAEEIFRQGRELVNNLKGGTPNTTLRLGSLGSLSKNLQMAVLKPVIQDSNYELNIEVGDPKTLLTRLMGFHLDAILCDVPYPHSEDEPLIQRKIAKEPMCFVARYRNASRLPLATRLEKHGVYLPAKSNPITTEIEAFLQTHRSRPKVHGYIDDIALLRLLALETDAIVAIPKVGASRDLASGTLVVVHEFESLYQRSYVVVRRDGARSQHILSVLNPAW
ncbi:MAG: LysR family transcriptional regulator [bacterium]|nr:LysR family transcriptional regulator [bacterium]